MPSLNWDRESHVEFLKFDSVSSHITYRKHIICIHFFYYLISALMLVFNCMMNNLRQMKKTILESMNHLLHNTIHQLVWYWIIIGNTKSIFLFLKSLFGENCVWFPCFLSSTKLFSLDISGKNYFLINFNLFFNLNEWWYFISGNTVSECIYFQWGMFLKQY